MERSGTLQRPLLCQNGLYQDIANEIIHQRYQPATASLTLVGLVAAGGVLLPHQVTDDMNSIVHQLCPAIVSYRRRGRYFPQQSAEAGHLSRVMKELHLALCLL